MEIFRMSVLLMLPLLCVSWWDIGHMLTAAIAEAKLLEEDLYSAVNFRELINSINHLCDGRSSTFIESACWADDIKVSKYGMKMFNHWHYKDGPYLTDIVDPIINYTESAVNSLEIMKVVSKVLKTNVNKITAERALFARFAVHLVGDIHQPLHSVALFNQTYPKGDVGGNFINVFLKNGSSMNFHAFWDAGGLMLQNDTYVMVRPMNIQNLTTLKRLASQLVEQYGKEVGALGEIIDPYVWTQESYQTAINTTYPFIAATNKLDDAYTQLTFETSKKRITLAGFRLANYIKQIYKSRGKTHPSKHENLAPNQVWELLAKDSQSVNQHFCKAEQKQAKQTNIRKQESKP